VSIRTAAALRDHRAIDCPGVTPEHPAPLALPADRAAFVARFGGVVEDSPWVAEAVWEQRPFADVDELHAAFERVLRDAPEDARLAVLRAHPELAVAGGGAPELSPESAREQAGAGLDRLEAERRESLAAGLRAYRERFGFPFVACVRDHGGAGLEELLAARAGADPAREQGVALREVSAIARHRLRDLCPS
jgi:OHCU decarboxylase